MKQLLYWLWGMAAVLCLFLTSVLLPATDRGYYESFYETSGLPEQLDLDSSQVMAAMDMMLDYVTGNRASMDGSIPGIGEVYNEKEKSHMVDVRALYRKAVAADILCAIVTAAGLFTRKWVWLAAGLLKALLCWGIVIAFLGLWMATGFDDFWTHFHQLFFTNDLWLLDPATDFMIRICPAELFSGLILRILLVFSAGVATLAAGSLCIILTWKRKSAGG